MSNYRERLTANATDFDSIVAEMLTEMDLLRTEARRYRWLREQYIGANFNFDDEGMCVLAFEIADTVAVSGDCDNTIDRAMLAERSKQ